MLAPSTLSLSRLGVKELVDKRHVSCVEMHRNWLIPDSVVGALASDGISVRCNRCL